MTHADSVSRAHKSTAVLFLLISLLLLSAATSASARTINALNSQDLRYALRQDYTSDTTKIAEPGDTIVLTAGETYEGPFYLPAFASNQYITIQSSNVTFLPEGKRVSGDGQNMPKIVTSINFPALIARPGSKYFKIIGIEFRPSSASTNVSTTPLVTIGLNSDEQNLLSLAPDHIILDRCYIHGYAGQPAKRGVALHGIELSVINSYIGEIHLDGQDSQGIQGVNGPGPYHIINNYIEGAAQNILFGGEPPKIPDVVPSDIEVLRNHLNKPLSWQQEPWDVKSHFELKTAKRVTVEGNIMENNWEEGNYGTINLFVEGGDSGSQATLQDIKIRNNFVRNILNKAVLIQGLSAQPSVQGHHIEISNNLFDDIGDRWMSIRDIDDLVIDHNTVFPSSNRLVEIHAPLVTGRKMTGFKFTNNIVNHGIYGFFGDVNGSYVSGDPPILTHFTSPDIRNNVIVATEQQRANYITQVQEPPNFWRTSVADVHFVDYAGHNYRLADNSPFKGIATDNKDIGADIDAIEAATGSKSALSLNGTNAYVNVPSNANNNLNITGPLTLEAWVKYTPNGQYQTIVAKECYAQAGCGGGYTLQISNTGKLRMVFYTSYNTYELILGSQTIPADQWVHVAGVFDGSQRRLYVGGVLDVSANDPTTPGSSGTTVLKIGRRSNHNSLYFKGLIDEVRVSAAAVYTSNFTPEASLSASCDTRGLWKFDGQTVDDSTGNNNPNTLVGGSYSTDVADEVKHSLSLNGTDAYVSVPHSTGLNITGAITLEAWVKYNSNGLYQNVVAKECYPQTGCGGYALQISNTGKLRFVIYLSANNYLTVTGATTVTPGAWHHVAAVFDGSQRRVYLDGVQDGTASGSLGPTTGTANLSIGRRSSVSQYYFNGLVDVVRVSAAALYTTSGFTPERSLGATCGTRGLWKFDGQVYTDISGNGNNGTAQGATAFSSDVP